MKKLILLDNGNNDNVKAETIIASLPEVNSVSIISNSSQLLSIVSTSHEDEIVISSLSLLNYPEQMAQAIAAKRISDLMLIQANSSEEEGYSESVTADTLVNLLAAPQSADFMVLSASSAAIKRMHDIQADQSITSALASLMIAAVAQSLSVTLMYGQVNFPGGAILNFKLNNAEKASALSFTLNSVNIEDLFPNYAWAEFEKEAAAVCFHTLTAHFIRLGDTASAEECLAMSEDLEDSPRALALRAMIFKQQGQTLGAVANLVSSLQQYETRKKNVDQQHYLSFSPANIEVVNTSLQQGLSALNKHENDKAFEHFVEAVFNFDDFYQTNGINQIKH